MFAIHRKERKYALTAHVQKRTPKLNSGKKKSTTFLRVRKIKQSQWELQFLFKLFTLNKI